MFIFSCAISCLIYYTGVIIFPLVSNKLRDEFNINSEEYALMLIIGSLGAFCGIGVTPLTD